MTEETAAEHTPTTREIVLGAINDFCGHLTTRDYDTPDGTLVIGATVEPCALVDEIRRFAQKRNLGDNADVMGWHSHLGPRGRGCDGDAVTGEIARGEIATMEMCEKILLKEERRLHDAGECPHVGQRPACWRGASLLRDEINRRVDERGR